MTDDAGATQAKHDQHDEHDEPASPEELAAAARLRDALERRGALPRIGAAPELTDEVLLARALPHAFAPRDIEPAVHERLLVAALAGREKAARRRWRGPVVVGLSLGGALAMAAAVLLVVEPRSASAPGPVAAGETVETVAPDAAMVPRSTEPLFVHERQPLARHGSARVDRIAQARNGEYLQARLTGWGAR